MGHDYVQITKPTHPKIFMSLAIIGAILVGLWLSLYPPLPLKKLLSLKEAWKNMHTSFAPTDLTKLTITDETMSNDDFTFYYPQGYVKDDSTSTRRSDLRTQLIVRYIQPKDKEGYNTIALEKILEPINLSTKEDCEQVEGQGATWTYQFSDEGKRARCIITEHNRIENSLSGGITTRYFYQSKTGDTYIVTTEIYNDDYTDPSLDPAAEKFELKN